MINSKGVSYQRTVYSIINLLQDVGGMIGSILTMLNFIIASYQAI
jgi:hypothetical protein